MYKLLGRFWHILRRNPVAIAKEASRLLGKYEYGWIWIRMHSLARGPSINYLTKTLARSQKHLGEFLKGNVERRKRSSCQMQNFSGLSGRQSCSIRHTPDLATNAWLPNALFRGNKDNSLKKRSKSYQFSQTRIACFMVYYVWARMCEVWLWTLPAPLSPPLRGW